MNQIKLHDELERKRIEQDLDCNFMVEAGAGSGKTTCLIKRMVSLISSGRCRIEQMAAITFTRKAAAELNQRFGTALKDAYQSDISKQEKERILHALSNIDRCFIGTVHSFCARLLRERPIEAGVDPNFKEMDEMQDKEFGEAVWYEFIEHACTQDRHLIDKLNLMGINPDDLKHDYYKMSEYADVQIISNPILRPDLDKAVADILQQVEEMQQYIPERAEKYDSLQKTIFKCNRYVKYFDMSVDANKIKLISLFEKPPSVVLKRWSSKQQARLYKQQIVPYISSEIAVPTLTAWREYCYHYIIQFLKKASDMYIKKRHYASCLNFFDLLADTANMLRNYPEVRSYFQDKYTCLLVDEFQDTDPIQAEIMFYLTGRDVCEKDWTKLTPKRGSLFVVGDPKQSIYRFRRADISIYNQVKQLIVKSGGEILKLTTNFRSIDHLCNCFNNIFCKLMPETCGTYQPDFVPLHAARHVKNGDTACVKIIDIPEYYKCKSKAREYDADYIAKFIKWAADGNLLIDRQDGSRTKAEYRDFMILLAKKDGLSEYYKALQRYNIPASISGSNSIKDYAEIDEFLKIIRFICYPQDKLMLAAVLKGIFFGFSDQHMYDYKCAGGEFDIFTDIPKYLPEHTYSMFKDAFEKLKKYINWKEKYCPYITVQKMVEDIGLIPLVMSNRANISYVYKLLETCRAIQNNGCEQLDKMIDQLDNILNSKQMEEEMSIFPDEQNAVKIMNLHKAKGLEAPVVFLALSERSGNHLIDRHVIRAGSQSKAFFCFTKPYGRYAKKIIAHPEGWDNYRQEEENYLKAENIRLLYVAATRAKNMLVISRWNKKSCKNAWQSLIQEQYEQLIVPDNVYTPQIQSKNKGNFSGLTEYRKQQHEWIKSLGQTATTIFSPTAQRDISNHPVNSDSGGGAEWGTAVHKIMEIFLKEGCPKQAVQRVLHDRHVLKHRYKDALNIIDIFKNTDIYTAFKTSKQAYTEVPILCRLDDSGSSMFSGVIDLIFKYDDGWVIVDYKTDSAKNDTDLNRLVKWYSEQIKMYCRIWERLTKQPVQAGYIYFTCGKAFEIWRGDETVG